MATRKRTEKRPPTADGAVTEPRLARGELSDALPEGWEVARLGDVIHPRHDLTQPSSNGRSRYVGLEHIDPGNARLSRWGTENEVKSSKNKFFADDVLYGKLRPYLDKVVLAEWEGMCATDILVFMTDKQRALPQFVVHLLHASAFLNHAIATTSGTNHPRTSWQALQTFFFFLPPLPQQRAIARVLSAIQRAIETQDKLIAAARHVKKALMRHLFTYGAVPPEDAARVPLKETEIGAVPEGWDVSKLGRLIEDGKLYIKNGFPQGGYNEAGEGVPHLRPFNVDNDGTITFEQIKSVPAPSDDSPYWIKEGDVIFNNTNSEELVGKTAFFHSDRKCVLSNHMTLVRVLDRDAVEAYWLAKRLHALWEEGLFRGICRRHVNQASVGLQKLKNLSLSFPPITEQHAIARILSAVDQKIAAEEKRKAALQTLFKTTLHQLMTGQVRVKAEG